MKKFILFQMGHYYPVGGMGDLSGSFDTLEEALAAIDNDSDEAEVVDRDTWQVLATASREYIPLNQRPPDYETLKIKIIDPGS